MLKLAGVRQKAFAMGEIRKNVSSRLQEITQFAENGILIVNVFNDIFQNDKIESTIQIHFNMYIINILVYQQRLSSLNFVLNSLFGSVCFSVQELDTNSLTAPIKKGFQYSPFPTSNFQNTQPLMNGQLLFD